MAAHRESLLIELGTEELPPGALDTLSRAFADAVCEGLARRGIEAGSAGARRYCSPRRLAVWIPAVADRQPEQHHERRGPAVSAGLDAEGNPTRALQGFAASCGVGVEALQRLANDRGEWFVHRQVQPGRDTASLLPEIVAEALKALPVPRPMRWGSHDYSFVRPAHWLVMLHGSGVVPGTVLGLESGRRSRGHRFHHPQPVEIPHADAWLDALRSAQVLADPAERRQRIEGQVRAATPEGCSAQLAPALLDEIANLTEWPVALCCSFDAEFLGVPQEVLVTTMVAHQRFVPVHDTQGRLTHHFIGVANIDSRDPEVVRQGYERVIAPRFADARFFFDEDRRQPLEAGMEALRAVTFQQKLGSAWDKTVRVAELARIIAGRLAAAGIPVDAALATRAAALSRCDLVSRMVGEFPELQGTMGRHYALASGEPEPVAVALESFYAPRHAGEPIAADRLGQVLGVAERLDTLAGIFAVGLKPTGNKDPFALRRAALGLARTLVEAGLPLDLDALLAEAAALLPDSAFGGGEGEGERRTALASEVRGFIIDRLRGYYADQGLAAEAFEAVRAVAPADLVDFDRRLRAVVAFAGLEEAGALAAANKRIGNLLRHADGVPAGNVDTALLQAGAEATLAAAIEAAAADTAPLAAAGDYVGLLRRLAALRAPVDAYFDAVMVMADDPALRGNRLALLARLQRLFLQVADIALLPVAG